MKKVFFIGFLFLIISSLLGMSQKEVSLTVYNQNFALIKDIRELQLIKGFNEVRFSDVAALIEPESVLFRSLSPRFPVHLIEQNYEFDLLNSEKLLRKYLEEKINITGKDDNIFEGILKSFQGDTLILQLKKGNLIMVRMDNIKTIQFPSLPRGLITRPTLVWWIKSGKKGKLDVEVSYITKGINWKADYVVRIEEREKLLALKGWVTLDNRAGATFQNANLKLVAGEVHRVEEKRIIRREMVYQAAKAGAPQFEEKPFFEYHMYTLKRKTTLKNNQIKQVSLLEASRIPFRKIYSYDGIKNPTKIAVHVEFTNSQNNNLGMPLPKGKVRVYKNSGESMEFIGEDKIDHTPKDEKVRLFLGYAFDLVGERKRVKQEKLANRLWEATYQILLRNHKEKEEAEIEVVEHLWGDWEIVSSSHEWEKVDAQTIKFKVKVKPDEEKKIQYTVRYRW